MQKLFIHLARVVQLSMHEGESNYCYRSEQLLVFMLAHQTICLAPIASPHEMRGETYDTPSLLIHIVISYLNPILIAAQASRAAIQNRLIEKTLYCWLTARQLFQSYSSSNNSSRKLLLILNFFSMSASTTLTLLLSSASIPCRSGNGRHGASITKSYQYSSLQIGQ